MLEKEINFQAIRAAQGNQGTVVIGQTQKKFWLFFQ
jgi:hypothetical protein